MGMLLLEFNVRGKFYFLFKMFVFSSFFNLREIMWFNTPWMGCEGMIGLCNAKANSNLSWKWKKKNKTDDIHSFHFIRLGSLSKAVSNQYFPSIQLSEFFFSSSYHTLQEWNFFFSRNYSHNYAYWLWHSLTVAIYISFHIKIIH